MLNWRDVNETETATPRPTVNDGWAAHDRLFEVEGTVYLRAADNALYGSAVQGGTARSRLSCGARYWMGDDLTELLRTEPPHVKAARLRIDELTAMIGRTDNPYRREALARKIDEIEAEIGWA